MGIRRADAGSTAPVAGHRGEAEPRARVVTSVAAHGADVDSFQPSSSAPKSGHALSAQALFQRPSTAGEWTLSAKGQKADPVTIYVHGSLSQLQGALQSTGWTRADPSNKPSDVKYVASAIADETLKGLSALARGIDGDEKAAGFLGRHPTPLLPDHAPTLAGVNEMPVSPQTYHGHPLVAAYECDNNPLGGRNHLRIFDTGKRDAHGQEVYAIAASRDSGIRFAPDHPETAFLFHQVDPHVAGERNFVLHSLQQSGRAARTESFAVPFGGASTYGETVSDSQAYEVMLR